jgi:flagellum-specific peptidoglycan hydrolase FlgJ
MKNLLLILISLLLFSCGTRKTNKSKTEIKTEASTTIEASTVAVSKTEKQTETDTKTAIAEKTDVIDETEKLEPIDPDKPMIKTTETKDGKTISTWQNARVDNNKKTDKSEKSTTEDKKEFIDESGNSNLSSNLKIKKDKARTGSSSEKNTKNISWSWWWLIVLVPIGGVVFYYSKK